jgi:hypothetical protein
VEEKKGRDPLKTEKGLVNKILPRRFRLTMTIKARKAKAAMPVVSFFVLKDRPSSSKQNFYPQW